MTKRKGDIKILRKDTKIYMFYGESNEIAIKDLDENK